MITVLLSKFINDIRVILVVATLIYIGLLFGSVRMGYDLNKYIGALMVIDFFTYLFIIYRENKVSSPPKLKNKKPNKNNKTNEPKEKIIETDNNDNDDNDKKDDEIPLYNP